MDDGPKHLVFGVWHRGSGRLQLHHRSRRRLRCITTSVYISISAPEPRVLRRLCVAFLCGLRRRRPLFHLSSISLPSLFCFSLISLVSFFHSLHFSFVERAPHDDFKFQHFILFVLEL
jgi:hypothetical protein